MRRTRSITGRERADRLRRVLLPVQSVLLMLIAAAVAVGVLTRGDPQAARAVAAAPAPGPVEAAVPSPAMSFDTPRPEPTGGVNFTVSPRAAVVPGSSRAADAAVPAPAVRAADDRAMGADDGSGEDLFQFAHARKRPTRPGDAAAEGTGIMPPAGGSSTAIAAPALGPSSPDPAPTAAPTVDPPSPSPSPQTPTRSARRGVVRVAPSSSAGSGAAGGGNRAARRSPGGAAAASTSTPRAASTPAVAPPPPSAAKPRPVESSNDATPLSAPPALPQAPVPTSAPTPAAGRPQPPANNGPTKPSAPGPDATPAEAPRAVNRKQQEIEQLRGRLVEFIPIGYSSSDASKRYVGQGVEQLGWSGFVAEIVTPCLDYGVRRVQLHNPFGVRMKPMELDQYIHAKESGLAWLTDGFVDAWKPVTRGDLTDGRPVEVIAYLGTYYGPDMMPLEDAGDWEAWLARAEESVRPAVEAGMSLAFDSFSTAGIDSYSYRFVQMLKARGVKTYIETWPKRADTFWHDSGVVVAEHWFQRNHTHPNVAARVQLTGDIVRLINKPPGGAHPRDPSWVRAAAVDAISTGYTAAARLRTLDEAGIPLQSVLEEAWVRRYGGFD